MEKMKLHTPNFTDENIAKIAELFPNCVTEAQEDDGAEPKQAIDFDLLKQELSRHIVDGPKERYRLDWPGKKESLLTANAPIAKTLRPCREESVDFDTTENLFIEGDNLDALKLLQESYLGKVKMIYIDPPYNTGKDFIYADNFAESTEEYLLESGQKDEEGNRLVANTDSNGRFHSDWLSMMYSRLKLARTLLKDDGVIFISIDDNEVHNLRKICDEIFGTENCLSVFNWKRRSGSNDAINNISIDHEYIVCYSKTPLTLLAGEKKDSSRYKNPDNDPRGPWARDNLTCGKTASERPNLYYPITDPKTNISYECNQTHVWRFEKPKMMDLIKSGKVIFPNNKNGKPTYKRHLSELRSDTKPISSILNTVLNSNATKEVRNLLGGQYFDYPKSTNLLKQLIFQATSTNDIILDFFAGSATTAHAVMQLNAEDGGKRKFIMVQLPEECDEKSEAFKAGYKTIAEISKERIRRAGKKIKEENATTASELDIGFRVLKVDSSNMNDVYYTPDAIAQDDLFANTDNIKTDRTPEDLLFQVLLDWGVDLTLPITKEIISGHEVFFVDGNALAACFVKDGEITEDFCKELAQHHPLRIVFRDSGFKDDSVKINVEQIFKLMSPHTDVKTI